MNETTQNQVNRVKLPSHVNQFCGKGKLRARVRNERCGDEEQGDGKDTGRGEGRERGLGEEGGGEEGDGEGRGEGEVGG